MVYLSYIQRYANEILLQAGESKSSIILSLSLIKSINGREIKQNCDGRSGI